MLTRAIERTVVFATRHTRLVLLSALAVVIASCIYAARNFAITTDVEALIPSSLSSSEKAYREAFPQHKILVVLEAPTPELADQAADKLTKALPAHSDVLQFVGEAGQGPFFRRNALLFLPEQNVARITGELSHSAPLLKILASDPSLRGIANTLSFAAGGVEAKQIALKDLARPLTLGANTLAQVLGGRPASFSWRVLIDGHPATPEELRRFIQVDPKLNFAALQPGRAATDAIRQAAADLKLSSDFQTRLRGLTGLQLNFANIIALPLLLGVGVAFKIYYITAWRSGKTNLLESALTRAVTFSAMTTPTAFGSLWLSNQPGISSMGKLMALSLACTLAAAVLFQPILMGPPRVPLSPTSNDG